MYLNMIHLNLNTEFRCLQTFIAPSYFVTFILTWIFTTWLLVTWLAWLSVFNMADADTVKALNGLLNGIAQKVYYNKLEITEELLKNELYPDLSQDEFHALHEKMRGLVKVCWQAAPTPTSFLTSSLGLIIARILVKANDNAFCIVCSRMGFHDSACWSWLVSISTQLYRLLLRKSMPT